MAYCRNCGAAITEKAVICQHCGVPQQSTEEGSEIGYGILGFCVPVAGLVLYIVWKDNKPKTAKAAGIGALIWFVLYIIICMFIGVLIGMSGY